MTGRKLTDELFDVLEGIGITPTVNGKPVTREQFKDELGRRAETKIKSWLQRLADEYIKIPRSE